MLENEPPRDREKAEIESKVLSIPRSNSGSYWQNNRGKKTFREFPDSREISQRFAPSCKYHSFFFFMQKLLNVQSYSNFSILTFYPAMFSDVRFQFI